MQFAFYILLRVAFLGMIEHVQTGFAQEVLFDFDNAPLYTSLPIDKTVNGITARLSATGQGHSIQNANVLGFTPPGFACQISYLNLETDIQENFNEKTNNFMFYKRIKK